MTDKKIEEFPDLTNKLAAPTKKSLFERQKAEAEAKRARDDAETAAVYEDFIKSFDEGDDQSEPAAHYGARRSGLGSLGPSTAAPSGPGRRHFTTGLKKSGPGSLGPAAGIKREHDGSRADRGSRSDDRGLFAFDDAGSEHKDSSTAFKMLDDEDEKKEDISAVRAAPKPTLQLSLLPPATSVAYIRSILPANLVVEGVHIVNQAQSFSASERKSMAAIVTLGQDTPASDIDAAVSALQGKYVGFGYNLSLSRHVSSASLVPISSSNMASASQPFGAQAKQHDLGGSMNRAPPPGSYGGGFAPPSSYEPNTYNRGGAAYEVQIVPPSDIQELKLIHKTVESLLNHGPEFEVLLMTRPEVQQEEKWAWLWNPRSPGGVWYRWRLWQILSGTGIQSTGGYHVPSKSHPVFTTGASWKEPEKQLPFEFSTQLPELISDSDYDSSDEDDSEDDNPRKRRRQMMHAGIGPPPKDNLNIGSDEQTYLNPMQRAKLMHLLSRLPTTNARLRKGDVARVTVFAISHASKGAAEIVDMLVYNVLHPFSWSKTANPEMSSDATQDSGKAETTVTPDPKSAESDTTPSTLIALYLISDILSASSTSGVRHAWRYRSLFESSLTGSQIFLRLGCLEKELGWGRIRSEKWRRSITGLLGLWESWGIFMGDVHRKLVAEFEQPIKEAEEERKKAEEEETKKKAKSGWKAVEAGKEVETAMPKMTDEKQKDQGMPYPMKIKGTDPTIKADSSDASISQSKLEVAPLVEKPTPESTRSTPMQVDPKRSLLQGSREVQAGQGATQDDKSTQPVTSKKRRPLAADMFASDEEDEELL